MSLITKSGLIKLKEQLLDLENEEVSVLQSVAFARSLGDLSENAELDAAKNDLERIQDKISVLKAEIASAVLFDPAAANKDVIGFCCEVELEDDNEEICTYSIVHSSESDVARGKISMSSPLAQAMLGKKVGDSFTFCPPAGEKTFYIVSIKYNF